MLRSADKLSLLQHSPGGIPVSYTHLYPIGYNTLAIKSLIRRAMDMGFYEGVNLSLSYCCLLYTSVSKDSVASHKRFEEKYGLAFTLLADPERKVCLLYTSRCV